MNKIILILGIIGLTGCAEYGGYQPVVDQAPVGGYDANYGYQEPSYQQGYDQRYQQPQYQQPNNLYQQNRQNSHLQQDMYECQGLAKRASGGAATETIKQGIVGGAIGAAGGAIVGAFTGNPAAGAAIGAAAGGFGGGAKGGFEADARYKRTYNDCLRGRGHRVLQ